jgi:hypothetical protein
VLKVFGLDGSDIIMKKGDIVDKLRVFKIAAKICRIFNVSNILS